jgi:hypothetical protein
MISIKTIIMKTIEPIQIWQNGQTKTASVLNAYVISDNLKDSATFYYALLTADNDQLAQGNLTMSGEDYVGFISNDYAFDWVATQLNVVITGDTVTINNSPEEEK